MLERDVIRITLARAKRLGVQSIRFHAGAGTSTGWPDYIFLIPGGRPVFIEFKKPGAKPTKLQLHRIETLKDLGYDVEVCDNPDTAAAALTSALDAARISSQSR